MLQSMGSRRISLLCDTCLVRSPSWPCPSPSSASPLPPHRRRPQNALASSFLKKNPQQAAARRISAVVINNSSTPPNPRGAGQPTNPTPTSRDVLPRSPPCPDTLAALAEDSCKKFLAVDGIPAPQLTTAALQSCLQSAATLSPLIKRAEAQARASASKLETLGAERTGARLPVADARLQAASLRISRAAFEIFAHPNVAMKPEYLDLYVHVMAQLGRAETLPLVLDMYAYKPKPVVRDGRIELVQQNPHAASRAIEVETAGLALQTAIEARNLDAALGITEAAYSVPAFKRQRIIKHTTVPLLGLAALPFGIFGLASGYALHWQNTMDVMTATTIGCLGFSGYCLSVGSLGLIAKLSNMDHMKRVTWAPGTPLRERWLREDERAALDKVACAWGFKESWRHGEEMGADWEGLHEYMGYRQMILDRAEFLQGMK